jgi:DNA/RNA endonuclease YhcR with UshA esterase domain
VLFRSDDAVQHLNETNTVCGTVASARFLEEATGSPTYLNLDHPYPNQSCAAVIAGAARAKFKVAPEKAFMGKWVCVTGLITTNYRGKVEIAVTDPAQIVAQDAPYTPTN